MSFRDISMSLRATCEFRVTSDRLRFFDYWDSCGCKWNRNFRHPDVRNDLLESQQPKRTAIMKLSGTIVNGQVHLDAPTELPDGTRVALWPQADFEVDFDYPHPMAPYDREKEAALLRESIADMQAGRGTEARDFLEQLARERGLSLEPRE